jgi:hypothetical protein
MNPLKDLIDLQRKAEERKKKHFFERKILKIFFAQWAKVEENKLRLTMLN